jgi:hypothetical protein
MRCLLFLFRGCFAAACRGKDLASKEDFTKTMGPSMSDSQVVSKLKNEFSLSGLAVELAGGNDASSAVAAQKKDEVKKFESFYFPLFSLCGSLILS